MSSTATPTGTCCPLVDNGAAIAKDSTIMVVRLEARMLLVSPTRDVTPRRRCLQEALEDLGGVHLVISQAADGIGKFGVAVPAMFGPVAVENLATIGGIGRFLEEVFHQVDGVVQVVIVHI